MNLNLLSKKNKSMKIFPNILPVFFAIILKAQAPDASIVTEQQTGINGFFFLAPYKVNATSPKTALLNKALILDSKGEVIYYRNVIIGNDFKIQSNGIISLWNG